MKKIKNLQANPTCGFMLQGCIQTTSKTNAEEGLEFCDKLFKLEREYRKEKQVLPKSSLRKAINYCLNQWDKLTAFMLDGRIEISNNRAERAVKPFVIGKNFYFQSPLKVHRPLPLPIV